jgi:hypothetical protein
MTAAAVRSNDMIHVVGGALYDVLNGMTGIVGLTPLQVVEGIVALGLLMLFGSLLLTLTGRRGWTFDDHRRQR